MKLTWEYGEDEHIVEGFRMLSFAQIRAVDTVLKFMATQSDDPTLAREAEKARGPCWARAAG